MDIQKPADLGEHGSKFWDVVMARMGRTVKPVDSAALAMACRWVDRFEKDAQSGEKGVDIKLGIATDKFLEISKRFGFTPKDREGKETRGRKPKAKEKKTALDDLTPAKLAGPNLPVVVEAKRVSD